ncbi:MAG: phosphatase [Desulfuromonadales bacterium]
MPNKHHLEADLHVHTVASGHAFSTIDEITREADRRGLRLVGMTDHGPALPGGPHPYHFMALRFVPPYLNNVRVLRGVEANITGIGEIDLPPDSLAKLDLVLAGFHEDCGFDDKGITANTEAVLALMDNPLVHVITHPGNPRYPLDYEAIVTKAAQTGTALEVNNSSFSISRKGSAANCQTFYRLAAAKGAPVAIGSDAHIAASVGLFGDALKALEEAGVRYEQIVNRTLESTLAFLGLDE